MNDFEKNVFKISNIYINRHNIDKSYSYTLYDFGGNNNRYKIGSYSEKTNFIKQYKEYNITHDVECITDYYNLDKFIKIISDANYGILRLDGKIFRREIYEYIKNNKIKFHCGRLDNPTFFYIDDSPYIIDKEDARYIKIGDLYDNFGLMDRYNRFD